MTLISERVKSYIGVSSKAQTACEPVERGAVRRFAQAIMDDDSAYFQHTERYGEPVAPPLFPQMAFRRPFGIEDSVQKGGADPDFDGNIASNLDGLPEIEDFRGMGRLNGGSEVEFYRLARHGETVSVTSCYEEIIEKEGRQGPFVIVKIVSDYTAENGDLLIRMRRTSIRRPV